MLLRKKFKISFDFGEVNLFSIETRKILIKVDVEITSNYVVSVFKILTTSGGTSILF